jgi:hypothetical protein
MSGSGNLLTIVDVRANTPLGSAARSRWVKKLKAVEGMVSIRCSLVGRLRIAESNRRSCGRRCMRPRAKVWGACWSDRESPKTSGHRHDPRRRILHLHVLEFDAKPRPESAKVNSVGFAMSETSPLIPQ